ncbi:MAG: HNH endonuclease [Enterocloster sp.]|uniref:HNH endonuclease n=2 Tax=Enterocloster sp. TaxID=2719315 RepID=UPI00399329E7
MGIFACKKIIRKVMDDRIQSIQKLIIEGKLHDFYNSTDWKKLRKQVLKMDKYECQICKSKGRYRKATTVHHVNYVKKHPELALDMYYTWQGTQKRNLLSLCHDCHEEVHGYRKKEKKLLTEERW